MLLSREKNTEEHAAVQLQEGCYHSESISCTTMGKAWFLSVSSPPAKWRLLEWEVHQYVSSEALQKNLVIFFNGIPQQINAVQNSLPQL